MGSQSPVKSNSFWNVLLFFFCHAVCFLKASCEDRCQPWRHHCSCQECGPYVVSGSSRWDVRTGCFNAMVEMSSFLECHILPRIMCSCIYCTPMFLPQNFRGKIFHFNFFNSITDLFRNKTNYRIPGYSFAYRYCYCFLELPF